MTIPVLLVHETSSRYDPELWRRLEPAVRAHYLEKLAEYGAREPMDLRQQAKWFGYLDALRWVIKTADEMVKGE